jgi:hypothetical protein
VHPVDSLLQVRNLGFTIPAAVCQQIPYRVTDPGHWLLLSRLTTPGQEFTIPTAVGQPGGPHLVTAPGHWPLRSRLTAPG